MASVGEVKQGLLGLIEGIDNAQGSAEAFADEIATLVTKLAAIFDGDENNGNFGLIYGLLVQAEENREAMAQVLAAAKENTEAYLGSLG